MLGAGHGADMARPLAMQAQFAPAAQFAQPQDAMRVFNVLHSSAFYIPLLLYSAFCFEGSCY